MKLLIKNNESSASILQWYHPHNFPKSALGHHHHNNIRQQQGVSVNQGNIRFTSQRSHYPTGCVKHMPCGPICPSSLAALKDH